jgi:hypothetical protein
MHMPTHLAFAAALGVGDGHQGVVQHAHQHHPDLRNKRGGCVWVNVPPRRDAGVSRGRGEHGLKGARDLGETRGKARAQSRRGKQGKQSRLIQKVQSRKE